MALTSGPSSSITFASCVSLRVKLQFRSWESSTQFCMTHCCFGRAYKDFYMSHGSLKITLFCSQGYNFILCWRAVIQEIKDLIHFCKSHITISCMEKYALFFYNLLNLNMNYFHVPCSMRSPLHVEFKGKIYTHVLSIQCLHFLQNAICQVEMWVFPLV